MANEQMFPDAKSWSSFDPLHGSSVYYGFAVMDARRPVVTEK
jgi:hypothetical protein